MKAYKGFNKDMTCRGFQYKEGGEYETAKAKCCASGFHACEHPLDCFNYYDPGQSVYHEVEVDGDIDRDLGDTKVAATKIKIGARLTIAGLVKAAIDYTMARVKPEAKEDEDHGYASATSYKSPQAQRATTPPQAQRATNPPQAQKTKPLLPSLGASTARPGAWKVRISSSRTGERMETTTGICTVQRWCASTARSTRPTRGTR